MIVISKKLNTWSIYNDSCIRNKKIQSVITNYNFPNDSSTLEHGYQPFGTYTATTFTVTFSDDGSGKTATQTVNPFQTIGYVIEEKALSKSGYYPMYYYNESLVTEDSEIKITSDINIKVIWKANS